METVTKNLIEKLQEQDWQNQQAKLLEKKKTVEFLGHLLRNSLLGLLTMLFFLVIVLISKSF